MFNYATRCNIAIGVMSVFTLTSCSECSNESPVLQPTYASWQIGNVIWEAHNPSVYTNGFLESDCNDNHKMFVGVSGAVDISVVNHPVVHYGTAPVPANAITLDITDDVGTDYLSVGGDTAVVQSGAGFSAPRIYLDNVKVVKAGSVGLPTDTTTVHGYINLP